MSKDFTLPQMLAELEYLLNRKLTVYENRLASHAFVCGLASGVSRVLSKDKIKELERVDK